MALHRKSKRARHNRSGVDRAPEAPAEPPVAPPVDEPAYFTPGESVETDIAPTIIAHQDAGREESPETDTAPSVIDHSAPSTPPVSPDAETCSPAERNRVPGDDLH